MDNLTVFTEFLLMDVTSCRELQVLQGVLFLGIYLGALTGNLVTVTVIMTDTCLHSPMYFFISIVSLIDLGSITVVVPKAIVNSMTDNKRISLTECAAQTFLNILFGAVEIGLLVVMSYDRYVAICHPLHYGLIITPMAVLGPTAKKPSLKNLLNAMFYTMMPPFVNPIIYCLRNREINAALQRMFNRELGRWGDVDNLTIFTEFLLMYVTGYQELQVLQGVLFLVIYLREKTRTLVTVSLIMKYALLHYFMYFFVIIVSLVGLGNISDIVCRAIVNSMTGSKTTSLTECAVQIYYVHYLQLWRLPSWRSCLMATMWPFVNLCTIG
ncbi:Olfactory receptor 14I1 [Heterocephalus glaber]|uniref:Olfactory receptor 14I1 n=1 Tax=Heterocephalus glaber TaxID=10181 RepID=G5B081_HETGA|nr:Olfactory receptor 14I1 [Heterocephalus glaber]